MKSKVLPRIVPARDDFYMGEAFLIASKSKDPNTQVGAVLISAKNKPISTGYNGPPSTMKDEEVNWARPDKNSADPLEKAGKYPYMIHAEDNAIKHAKGKKLRGATVYVTAAPCGSCMLDIADAGIARVVFYRPEVDSGSMLADDSKWIVAQDIARRAGVTLEEYCGDLNWIRDRVAWMESVGIFKRRG